MADFSKAYAEDRDAALPWADWLTERQVSLWAMLRAYAGTAERDYLDGLPHEVLTLWCRNMAAEWATEDATARMVAACQPDRQIYREELLAILRNATPDRWSLTTDNGPLLYPAILLLRWQSIDACDPRAVAEVERLAQGPMLRDWKRRTLCFFGCRFQHRCVVDLVALGERYDEVGGRGPFGPFALPWASLAEMLRDDKVVLPAVAENTVWWLFRREVPRSALLQRAGVRNGRAAIVFTWRPFELIPDERELARVAREQPT